MRRKHYCYLGWVDDNFAERVYLYRHDKTSKKNKKKRKGVCKQTRSKPGPFFVTHYFSPRGQKQFYQTLEKRPSPPPCLAKGGELKLTQSKSFAVLEISTAVSVLAQHIASRTFISMGVRHNGQMGFSPLLLAGLVQLLGLLGT